MNILLVCTGNTCRSPMAEGILKDKVRKIGRDDLGIGSAGIFAFEGQEPSDFADIVMQNRGIDISEHRARKLNKDMIDRSDIILTMTDSQKQSLKSSILLNKNKIYTLSEFVRMEGEISDPFGCPLEVYEQTAYEMDKLLDKLIEKIDGIKER